ncbi:hypothetical protein OHS17_33140 (plasmid) [Streptomyces sp. NBC_00523]|nr:hypothetical protein OHS17_33140 [Streptomyces sp. NBC_00523]
MFDSFLKGTRLDLDVIGVRFHRGRDTAVAVTRGAARKHGAKEGRYDKITTYTLVPRGDGTWGIAAVQKTGRRRLMEAFSFRAQPATRPSAG